jgi:hypothetical protein
MKKLIFLLNLILINFCVNAQQYLNKDFNDLSLTSGGWTTQIITGTSDWFASSFSGDDFVKISNYNNNQNSSANTWLISPSIDLSSATQPILNFKTIMKYQGFALSLKISTDYDGTSNPTQQGTWNDISNLAIWDTDASIWGDTTAPFPGWYNSGDIDLSSYISGTTYIAFEYLGSNTDGSTWEIDNIQINEGTSDTVSIDENSITSFAFYPNPLNSNNLNVEVDKNSSIILYDYSGQIIRSFYLKPGINNLNLSNISNGLYLIKYGSKTYMFSKI